ncbi:MAG TPA: OmpA family protein, partial [Rhizomicrobium sp.]
LIALMTSAPALAQLYPGDDVQVNASAIGRPMLHHHTKHGLPPDSPGVIHLHMPRAHHAARHAAAVAKQESTAPAAAAPQPKTSVATAAPPPAQTKAASDQFSWGAESPVAQSAAPPRIPAKQSTRPRAAAAQPKPTRAERRAALEAAPAGAPAASSDSGDMPFSFEAPDAQHAAPAGAAPGKSAERKPSRTSKVASLERAPAETPTHAKPEKVPHAATHAGQMKQGEILFASGGTDPDAASYQQVKTLAASLNTALESGAAGVEVDAFGGSPGDKSSDARRLSLRRALAVRQLLIDNGVPADRINVRAMGGTEDQGKPDRVDIYVGASKSG